MVHTIQAERMPSNLGQCITITYNRLRNAINRKGGNHGKRSAYFYFMKREPEKIQSVVPSHIEYREKRNLNEYKGGPFANRSGGLITFEAENIENATGIIVNDPFVSENLIENKWIKWWMVE